MAKTITLSSGRAFQTVTAAKQHFAKILHGQELKTAFSDEYLADIRAVYTDYCARTGWSLASTPVCFYPTHDRGPGYTTRCFGVTFQDGTTANFSMDKALRTIAA
jgi:hypothetical protein